jgi:HAD superfamily hydrolase (TIGR01549 family)
VSETDGSGVRPAVTLDLWHTLVYLEPDAEERYMGRQVDAAVRVLSESETTRPEPRASEGEIRSAFEREYARAVSTAGEGRSVTPAEQLERAASAVGRVARPREYLDRLREIVAGTPFRRAPGALELLGDLRDRGYSLAVISNTIGEPGQFLRPVMERMGFDEFLRVYTFSDEHPWTKPSPEIFRTTLERLGSAPAHAVHVGDGWPDIEGARRARMLGGILFTGLQQYGARYRSLFLPDGWDRPETSLRAATLAEVAPIVGRLLGRGPADA